MTMNAEQAAEHLANRTRRPERQNITPEERKRRSKARGRAQGAALMTLSGIYKDEYDVLYRAALEQELAK